MRKAKDLIGMPVVVSESHTEIERVEGLVLDISETHVTALVVDKDDRLLRARVVPLYDVESFGEAEIEVPSTSVVHAVDQIPDIRKMMNRDIASTTHLVASDGTDVGTVNDVLFDEDTGDIESFETFSEARASIFSDRFALPLYDALDDGLIAHASAVSQLAEQERHVSYHAPDSDEEWMQATSENGILACENESENSPPFSAKVGESLRHWRHLTWNFLRKIWHNTRCNVSNAYRGIISATGYRRPSADGERAAAHFRADRHGEPHHPE